MPTSLFPLCSPQCCPITGVGEQVTCAAVSPFPLSLPQLRIRKANLHRTHSRLQVAVWLTSLLGQSKGNRSTFFCLSLPPHPFIPPFPTGLPVSPVCLLISPAWCGRTSGGRWRGRSVWKRSWTWGCACPASCCWRCCTAGTSAPSSRRSSAAASTTTPSSSTSTWPSTCTTWVSVPRTPLCSALLYSTLL